jgi:uncharacterized protein (TIGR02246 family)
MKSVAFLAGGVVACLGFGLLASGDDPRSQPKPGVSEPGREADTQAIRATAQQFADAFNKHDAKTVAAQWTEIGECVDADGELIRGRADIEKSFAEFFKANPNCKIQVQVQSVRFPAQDLAVEEGIIRQVNGVKDLPSTTRYSATDVRVGGKWQTAVSRE